MYPQKTARQRMLRGKEGIMSLAQGIVHWAPPAAALEAGRSSLLAIDARRSFISPCCEWVVPICANHWLRNWRRALSKTWSDWTCSKFQAARKAAEEPDTNSYGLALKKLSRDKLRDHGLEMTSESESGCSQDILGYTWIPQTLRFHPLKNLRVRWFWAAPRNWWNWWDSHVTYGYNGFAYRGCWWYVFVSKCRIPPNPGRPWYGEVVSTEFVEPNRRRWWLAKVSQSLEGGPVGDRAKVVEACGQTAGRFTNFLVHFFAKQILLL